jgi:hypothetical protein
MYTIQYSRYPIKFFKSNFLFVKITAVDEILHFVPQTNFYPILYTYTPKWVKFHT